MTTRENPLLGRWDTPYGLPPFTAVRADDFPEAFERAWQIHRDEIAMIVADSRPADFDNTVLAFDTSGERLAAIEATFRTLTGSASDDTLQAVERQLAGPIAAHRSSIFLDGTLFARLDAVHERRHAAGLDDEQRRLVERVHRDFVRAGARLQGALRERYAAIEVRMAELNTGFSQNVMADEARQGIVLRGEADLVGLPDFLRDAARQAALERQGASAQADAALHLITLSYSMVVPFLNFSARRDLREAAWRAWTGRGETPGEHDNRPLAREILALRNEQARAHGFSNFADLALGDTMATNQQAVRELLERAWVPARLRACQELDELKALAREIGAPDDVQPWDWRYLTEILRQRRYAIDEGTIKPYFRLEAVTAAAFDCAERLFGLSFVPQPQVAAYHPDVQVYEVRRRAAGQGVGQADELVGIFLHDNFARAGKCSGAWMDALRWQSRAGQRGRTLPIVINNNNFVRASGGGPTLLSFDDAATLFHEFGHGLHGLLSDVDYVGLSGTQVLRDFVELPSQLYEHWIREPSVLRVHARHVETGEPLPEPLIERLRAAMRFNQGFETVRYLGSALVDLAVHASTDPAGVDVVSFERAELERLGAPAACGINHRLPHFQHLFSDDSYAAGYYVYMWAEVLEADAFEAFVEAGDVFDPALAERLRQHVYAAGNKVEPGETYLRFRGRPARVEAMLRQRGLLEA